MHGLVINCHRSIRWLRHLRAEAEIAIEVLMQLDESHVRCIRIESHTRTCTRHGK